MGSPGSNWLPPPAQRASPFSRAAPRSPLRLPPTAAPGLSWQIPQPSSAPHFPEGGRATPSAGRLTAPTALCRARGTSSAGDARELRSWGPRKEAGRGSQTWCSHWSCVPGEVCAHLVPAPGLDHTLDQARPCAFRLLSEVSSASHTRCGAATHSWLPLPATPKVPGQCVPPWGCFSLRTPARLCSGSHVVPWICG